MVSLDTIIAALAEANDCVVTDNEKDFEGVQIINKEVGR
jgi:toxin FitB